MLLDLTRNGVSDADIPVIYSGEKIRGMSGTLKP